MNNLGLKKSVIRTLCDQRNRPLTTGVSFAVVMMQVFGNTVMRQQG